MRVKLLVSLVFLFFFTGCAQLADTFSVGSRSAEIVKSQNDKRSYQYVTLKNGLRVLLVSDATADVAAVSLDVFVGSGSDPEHRQGLAHFLEHMLFLGTQKYPEAGEYQAFIQENAGVHNAFTDFEHTNYFFTIKPDKLDSAMDRFAQFFISPLFDENYVEREKNAVDSEYRARIKDEGRRKLDVLKQVVNQDHPFHKFSIGSLDTLSSDKTPIRDDLVSFYNTWYSAKNMTLVVLGSESITELQQIVERYFLDVPSFDVPDNQISQPLFDENALPEWIEMKPEKQVRELVLLFPLPDQTPYFRSKPLMLVGHLLGHEGKGSLLSYLKSMNWAESVSSGSLLDYNGGTIFTVSISLTEQGLKKQHEIIESAFSAIERLRKEGVPRWVFDEVARINELEFQFKEANNPMYYVMGLSRSMHYFESKYILSADYVLEDYRPELIDAVMNQLVLSNCLIGVIGAEFQPDKQTPFFEVPYKVSALEQDIKKQLESVPLLEQIRLPEKNFLLPEEISVIDTINENSVPRKLADDSGVKLWYKSIDAFSLPKSTAYYSFQRRGIHDSARDSTLLELYVALLNDSLNELTYPAEMAGLSFSLYSHARGASLKLSGFSDKQDELLEMIIHHIANADFTVNQFDRIKSELQTDWENADKQPPYRKLMSAWGESLQSHSWDSRLKIAAIGTLTLEDVKHYSRSFWQQMSVIAMNNGNVREKDALMMLGIIKKFMPDIQDVNPVIEVRQLNAEAVAVIEPSEYKDAGYLLYWQGENNSIEMQARMMVMAAALESDFFNQLRTEQQFGYIVFENYYPVMSVPGLVFVVQSPVATVGEIHNAVLGFLSMSQPVLAAMPEEQLEIHKRALVHELQEKPKSLAEESNDYWYDLALGVESFDRKEQLAQAITSLTIDQWRQFVAVTAEQVFSRMYLLTTEYKKPLQPFRSIKSLKDETPVKQYVYQ